MPKFQKGNPGGPMLDRLAGSETVVRKMIEAASDGDRVAAQVRVLKARLT